MASVKSRGPVKPVLHTKFARVRADEAPKWYDRPFYELADAIRAGEVEGVVGDSVEFVEGFVTLRCPTPAWDGLDCSNLPRLYRS